MPKNHIVTLYIYIFDWLRMLITSNNIIIITNPEIVETGFIYQTVCW